jgi:eukaryotic-like serine/threonine-protein kinase
VFAERNSRRGISVKPANETGRVEVYVHPFPSTGAKWLISRNGGTRPRWRRDGRELFYVTAGTLSAAPIVAGETFQAGEPSALFDISFGPSSINAYPYAASADGERFLVITPEETGSTTAFAIVLNWTAALRN